jgi:hypothetical protein
MYPAGGVEATMIPAALFEPGAETIGLVTVKFWYILHPAPACNQYAWHAGANVFAQYCMHVSTEMT